MTINIALCTYDSIVLGCDSISSVVETAVLPYRNGISPFVLDKDGMPVIDEDGNNLLRFNINDAKQMATTVLGGVSKMFCLYQDDDTSVAALTAGLAIIGGLTVAEHAKRFRRKITTDKTIFNTVEDVAAAFKTFMCKLWHEDFDRSGLPDIQYFSTVQFIVAGYGRDDESGRIFRIDCAADSFMEQFPENQHTGVCWGGTADYVERLLRGSDGLLQYKVARELARAMKQQRENTINELSKALTDSGVSLPDGLDIQVHEEQVPTLPWDSVTADVDYGNLSTQYAIDFVELLVNIQSGMQRFARGIPVVGGRTHIGVLRRGERFEMLNEPKLQHKHTGYSDEF